MHVSNQYDTTLTRLFSIYHVLALQIEIYECHMAVTYNTYTHVEYCEKVRSWPATMLQKGERKQGEEHQEVSL